MILHVDMDAFFASVEVLDNPELAGKCVIVGGVSGRGVVSAASYEARRCGVHSAMPMYQARRKCPHGIFLKPRPWRYKDLSGRFMTILSGFSPLVEPVSIDEAYVDISGCEALYGRPEAIGARIKERIRKTLGLTCTVGIAPLKFLAKIASDMDKPDGLTCIAPAAVPEFIARLPVEKVPGVGRQTRSQLERLGIATLGDVRNYSAEQLSRRLGKYGNRLAELADGIDHSKVKPTRVVKSISSEATLSADTRDRERLESYLLCHAEDVGRQLRRKGLWAKTVTLKLKHADFTQITRQRRLALPARTSEALFKAACELLMQYKTNKPVRLIGLGVSELSAASGPVQLSLFDTEKDSGTKWDRVDNVVDTIAERFGPDTVKKARLVETEPKTE